MASPDMTHARAEENEQIAQWLRQAAEILQAQHASAFRVAAYRRAAETVQCARPVREIYSAQGRAGLDALPGIGTGMAAAIAEMLETGRWARLERLKGSLDPAVLFRTIPGVGCELAERIHDELGIETLEALEAACHDGRLANVPGVGPRRVAAIRAGLGDILGRARLRYSVDKTGSQEPSVSVLLAVDYEYRNGARAGRLPTIAPRRFNPDHDAWLPVLHVTHGRWHLTALFSNTAHAHALKRTHDWVVLHFYDDEHGERQRTVVTEQRGILAGRRVVRGRESECEAYYVRAEGVLAGANVRRVPEAMST